VALIVIAVAAPQLIPEIGKAIIGTSASATAQYAAGAAAIQGTTTLATGEVLRMRRKIAAAAPVGCPGAGKTASDW